ncbi:MAG: hypothetical protein GF364_20640 [Candidatus Lokiarchaeota archaeon]|nr:hypothetical protein [Candidatus Lokiarchaeota archaeon]
MDIYKITYKLLINGGSYDNYLTTTNDYKHEVLLNVKISQEIKQLILNDYLPRFFWVFRCFDKDDFWLFDIIIDATDIDPPIKFYRFITSSKETRMVFKRLSSKEFLSNLDNVELYIDEKLLNLINRNFTIHNIKILFKSISNSIQRYILN